MYILSGLSLFAERAQAVIDYGKQPDGLPAKPSGKQPTRRRILRIPAAMRQMRRTVSQMDEGGGEAAQSNLQSFDEVTPSRRDGRSWTGISATG